MVWWFGGLVVWLVCSLLVIVNFGNLHAPEKAIGRLPGSVFALPFAGCCRIEVTAPEKAVRLSIRLTSISASSDMTPDISTSPFLSGLPLMVVSFGGFSLLVVPVCRLVDKHFSVAFSTGFRLLYSYLLGSPFWTDHSVASPSSWFWTILISLDPPHSWTIALFSISVILSSVIHSS
ncbi:hypothetical protein BDZ45DRAFT_668980 [Acephala macrosclerotiorum]|nr:hypothetical protein BDZ45DRAFT_668980 [Acephala macrosclerotiorum]